MKKLIGFKSRLLIGTVFLFAIISILNSCQKTMSDMYDTGGNTGGSKGPGANEVFIQGLAFNPSSITVIANTTITWTNKDGIVRTVTSDTDLFDSGSIGSNGTYSFIFATAGTYTYYCAVHPSMTATVKVN